MSSTLQHTQVASVMTEPLEPITSIDKLINHLFMIKFNWTAHVKITEINKSFTSWMGTHNTRDSTADLWIICVNYRCITPILLFLYISLELDTRNCHFKLNAWSSEIQKKNLRINFIFVSCAIFRMTIFQWQQWIFWLVDTSKIYRWKVRRVKSLNDDNFNFRLWLFYWSAHVRSNFSAYIIHKVDLDYSDRKHIPCPCLHSRESRNGYWKYNNFWWCVWSLSLSYLPSV